MKHLLLAGVAILALAGVAHAAEADMSCHVTDQRGNTNDYTFHWTQGPNTTVQELSYSRNGQLVNNNHTPLWHMLDHPNSSTITSDEAPGWYITYATIPGDWTATLWHNHNMVAQGQCYGAIVAAPTYTAQAPAPAYNPPPAQVASEDSVDLINVGHSLMVRVQLGSQWTVMTVDTGASIMLVPAKIADQLVESGEADYGPNAQVTLADGTHASERQIRVHSLTVGQHTFSNVVGTVAPDGSDDAIGLLSLPVLDHKGKFTIDTQNNKLIFG